jgi:dTDP-4-dehydrorhamnose 3,5-epimerase-like enzyme
MKSYKLINFKTLGVEKGPLISLEKDHDIPFEIKRVYYIFDTKKGVERGFHAHKKLKQLAIAVKGSCIFSLDDGNKREEIQLDSPKKGLMIEGLVWREMKDFSEDCVIVVVASDHYDESDYVRDYDKFISKVNSKKEI